MKFQKEEISDIFYVSYKEFKAMVQNRHPELLMHDNEFKILLDMFDKEYLLNNRW